MRTLFIGIITAMLTATNVSGQVNPMVLSDHQAMVRVDEGKAYLLLPVQEKEEYANVRMIVGNENVRSFNVRLAVDKVDYYVPLKVSGGELLDITFHGDRRTTGAVREFACWREMKSYLPSRSAWRRETVSLTRRKPSPALSWKEGEALEQTRWEYAAVSLNRNSACCCNEQPP